ncbi:hypothetical protein AURDEDRAFT_155954 [Auricularia subglabra TFB-10046 SS5]|nr:hypothetical protein AURDEDRAFT_155954 [Auricularia subglabra TFB-10046 SS5]
MPFYNVSPFSSTSSLSGFPGQHEVSLDISADEAAIHNHLERLERLRDERLEAIRVLLARTHPHRSEEERELLLEYLHYDDVPPVNAFPGANDPMPELVADDGSDGGWELEDVDPEIGLGNSVDPRILTSPHVRFAPGLLIHLDDSMDVLADEFDDLSLNEKRLPERPSSPLPPSPPPPTPSAPRRRTDTPHPQAYVPPGRRQQDDPRIFYSTLIDGAFDNEPPSEFRKTEYIADRIAANCRTIAMSPRALTYRLLNFDDHSKLEILRLSEALRLEAPNAEEPSPIVRINRCAVHPYGFDLECVNAAGETLWQRDTDLLHHPGARELVYEFWENAPRTLTLEQIAALRKLPQYAFEEGERILAPMWRRALTQDQSVTSAYIV